MLSRGTYDVGMELISINIGMPTAIDIGGERVTTGICKRPVDGPRVLSAEGLEGDGVGNTKSHGGPDQAVFAYASEHYDHWSETYGRDDLAYGLMGENLTVRGWLDEDVCVGDTYKVGEAVVQITGPRNPCWKLEHMVGIKGFAKRYADDRRFGLYMRVLEAGEIKAGDEVALIEKSPSGFGVVEAAELMLYRSKDVDGMRRALKVQGLGVRVREKFEQRVAAVEAG